MQGSKKTSEGGNSMAEETKEKIEEKKPEETALDRLFIDRPQPIDEKELAEWLSGKVTLTQEGRISITSSFNELKNEPKILTLLLAKKALKIKGIVEEEYLAPKELQSITSLGSGTVSPVLTFLIRKGLINKRRGYGIPDGLFSNVMAYLKSEKKVNE